MARDLQRQCKHRDRSLRASQGNRPGLPYHVASDICRGDFNLLGTRAQVASPGNELRGNTGVACHVLTADHDLDAFGIYTHAAAIVECRGNRNRIGRNHFVARGRQIANRRRLCVDQQGLVQPRTRRLAAAFQGGDNAQGRWKIVVATDGVSTFITSRPYLGHRHVTHHAIDGKRCAHARRSQCGEAQFGARLDARNWRHRETFDREHDGGRGRCRRRCRNSGRCRNRHGAAGHCRGVTCQGLGRHSGKFAHAKRCTRSRVWT